MPSYLDSLMRRGGASMLRHATAERDAKTGRLDRSAVTIRPKDGPEQPSEASLGRMRTTRVDYDDLGAEVREYRDEIEVDLYGKKPPMNAMVHLTRYPETDFHIDEVLSEAPEYTRVRLRRSRPYAKNKPGIQSAGR